MEAEAATRKLRKQSQEAQHCREHARFVDGCVSCCRARDAFLPYKGRVPEPPKTARAFGYTDQMTPGMIHSLTHLDRQDWRMRLIRGIVHLVVPFGWR
jgi:hypothetical protein